MVAVQDEVAREQRHIATHPDELRTVEQQAAYVAEWLRAGNASFVAVLTPDDDEREDESRPGGRDGEEDGAIVGLLGVHRGERHANRHVGDIGISVAASHRGRGVGRALMLAAETWARQSGVRKLTLGVFEDNERALRLYRSLGYVEEGIRHGHWVVGGAAKNEILMAKWVT
jgi:ribosomal protein S18 acetylase RimI-like enzyme